MLEAPSLPICWKGFNFSLYLLLCCLSSVPRGEGRTFGATRRVRAGFGACSASARSWGGRETLGSLHKLSHLGLSARLWNGPAELDGPLWPEAALGVVCAPSPGVLQTMQPLLPTLPGPSSHLSPHPSANWGLGPPSQAGEMSDTLQTRAVETKPGPSPRCGPHSGDGTPWVPDVPEQPAPSRS